jgi:hypothetical protein
MTIALAIRAIPEQGQLVEVRGRRFVVTDVRSSVLPFVDCRRRRFGENH